MAVTTAINFGSLPWEVSYILQQGQSWREFLTIADNGTALSLTDVTYALTLSTERGGTSVLTGTTAGDWTTTGVRVVSASGGQITPLIAAADTTALKGTYFFTLVLTFPSDHSTYPSEVMPLMSGFFTFLDNATS